MKKLLLLPFVALLMVACSSVEFKENVEITSNPAGADVYINGVLSGQTPLNIALAKDGTYDITIAKIGYKPLSQTLGSTNWNPYVKFGPLVDLGYYKEIVGAPVSADLRPDFLPETVGSDPLASMAYCVTQADMLKTSRVITDEEHSYLIKTIIKFFSAGK